MEISTLANEASVTIKLSILILDVYVTSFVVELYWSINDESALRIGSIYNALEKSVTILFSLALIAIE